MENKVVQGGGYWCGLKNGFLYSMTDQLYILWLMFIFIEVYNLYGIILQDLWTVTSGIHSKLWPTLQ